MPKQPERVGRWGNRTLALGVSLIVVMTLFPFQFFPQDTALRRSGAFVHWLSTDIASFQDFAENILLFVPFGFGLACFARERRWKNVRILFFALLVGACLSFVMELLQVFLPTRDPSWRDVVSNTAGSVIGYVVFRSFGSRIMLRLSVLEGKVEECLTLRRLLEGLFCYLAFAILVSVSLQRDTSLWNWDSTYPLLLGNDPTGERPWNGRISELEFADRATSVRRVRDITAKAIPLSNEDNVVAVYRLSESFPIPDTTDNPPEYPRSSKPTAGDPSGRLAPTSQNSLTLWNLAARITESARTTNQFTLRVVCVPGQTKGTPFGRIVSLSQDRYHVDFILSQEGTDLVFGFRTPLTGEKGEPALVSSRVFATTNPKDVVLTYDGSLLRLYINGKQDTHTLLLSPGASLFQRFSRLEMYELRGYSVLYEACLFVPLGGLVALASRRVGNILSKFLLSSVAFTPPILLEAVLATVRAGSFNLGNAAVGICITIGTVAICNSDRNPFFGEDFRPTNTLRR